MALPKIQAAGSKYQPIHYGIEFECLLWSPIINLNEPNFTPEFREHVRNFRDEIHNNKHNNFSGYEIRDLLDFPTKSLQVAQIAALLGWISKKPTLTGKARHALANNHYDPPLGDFRDAISWPFAWVTDSDSTVVIGEQEYQVAAGGIEGLPYLRRADFLEKADLVLRQNLEGDKFDFSFLKENWEVPTKDQWLNGELITPKCRWDNDPDVWQKDVGYVLDFITNEGKLKSSTQYIFPFLNPSTSTHVHVEVLPPWGDLSSKDRKQLLKWTQGVVETTDDGDPLGYAYPTYLTLCHQIVRKVCAIYMIFEETIDRLHHSNRRNSKFARNMRSNRRAGQGLTFDTRSRRITPLEAVYKCRFKDPRSFSRWRGYVTPLGKYHKVNLQNVPSEADTNVRAFKNTVEFRQHGPCLDSMDIRGWVWFCTRVMYLARTRKWDDIESVRSTDLDGLCEFLDEPELEAWVRGRHKAVAEKTWRPKYVNFKKTRVRRDDAASANFDTATASFYEDFSDEGAAERLDGDGGYLREKSYRGPPSNSSEGSMYEPEGPIDIESTSSTL